ncbi:alternate-type signal peptide domain-containing protein [Streptomyces sp.]|uniref:alternate-type signal peptide domain-containing protein n=1 Tax=Streptomyces sp. TaxID=1931 RepID=UPI002811B87D|nr:alternate-type signal peptide domain-containing protein [Streptomyces sp.]
MNTAAQTPLSESTAQTGRSRRAGKAALAGAVAVGLLAAGGGTFSKWSDSEAIASQDIITAGELSMAGTTVAWKDGAGTTIDPAKYQIVPGDTIALHASTKVIAEGDNLRGSLKLELPAQLQQEIAALERAGYVSYDVTLTSGDKSVKDAFPITADDNGDTVTAVASFTWNGDMTTGSDGENVSKSLSGTKLVLAQQ